MLSMEMLPAEINLESRVQQLEAQNRRLTRIVLALALLILLGALLFQLRSSFFRTAETEKPLAFFLDEGGKPEAAVQVASSGQVRVVSLRPDGRLPSLNVDGSPNRNYVMLYDSGGKPRMVFAPRPSEQAAATAVSSKPQLPEAHAAAGGGHTCNLSLPVSASDGDHHATQVAKKEEGEAASVVEEPGRDGSR